VKPAWSWQFERGHLPALAPTLPDGPIDREWAFGDRRGTGVKVGIIDSGIEAGHPDVGAVAGGVLVEPDAEHPDGVRLVETAHEDVYGHGTSCAGIIRSTAPGVELYSIRVLGKKLTGKAYVFAAGLRWAIDNGMHVVNLSLSTHNESYFGWFHELCDLAYFNGITLVSALNNVPGPSYPSSYATVCSVAAVDDLDTESWYYNPSGPAEFGAAGIDVSIPWKGGQRIVATGNSFAAPLIAGHAARIVGAHPGMKPFEVKSVLRSLAVNARR
jgi:subtilisin